MDKDFAYLLQVARKVQGDRQLSRSTEAGGVGAALLTSSGRIYTGVCIDTPCSMGFCAEHGAIAAMATAGESRIIKIVAVGSAGNPIPPCGRCRELIHQIDDRNRECRVLLPGGMTTTIRELLPHPWN